MKEESRKILDELIREHSSRYERPSGLSDEEYERIDTYNYHEDKIENFLKSIPQIESHLCKGGYIQDKNGTPCCHGDKIKFKFSEKDFNEHWRDRYARIEYGELKFDVNDKKFVILFGEDKNGFDWIDWNSVFKGCEWFEKVEK